MPDASTWRRLVHCRWIIVGLGLGANLELDTVPGSWYDRGALVYSCVFVGANAADASDVMSVGGNSP